MVAEHNLMPAGTSKRNPNPNLDLASQIKRWKSRADRRERAANGPQNPPRDRAEAIHFENHGPLRERVKAGFISPKDAIAIVSADPNGSEAFIRWARNRKN